ncbi:ABC transporter substrate-binding protein [Neptunomonas qingdaonensis]|uniref:ABC-type uncharacterized transport system, substrate-binding protein n=1 Tax=Neptunomonas qingdaonensis TaxID=1045558 RepID=A0A1I2V6P1_9GAMM|nr:ABC transporter substrate binding protein [Neptunomonas qingdaonensis]SFG84800.1 ABC-type uncharacterized transport system, substrate-binding protein [Neptunomonas qingdaonensis]
MNNRKWDITKIRLVTIVAILLFTSIFCQAFAASKLTILVSSESPAYKVVVRTIHRTLQSDIQIEEYTPATIDTIPAPPQLLLTVGSAAFKLALEKFPEAPVIASFLPRRVFEQLLSNSPRSLQNTTAIFIDQSMLRQLTLARLIAPNGTSIGTVFGASSIKESQRLHKAAEETGFRIKSVQLNPDDNPVNTLRPVIQETDIFLAIPDKSAFNRASAKWSLFMTLRGRKPLIGFSEKYVDAGALAAVFSSPEQIGTHTAEALDAFITTGSWPKPEHPKYFSVKLNYQSAHTIQIQLPNTDTLQHHLEGIN